MGGHDSLMYHLLYRGLNMLATKLLIDRDISSRVFDREKDRKALEMFREEHQVIERLCFERIAGPDTFELTDCMKEFEARCTMAKM